MLRGYSELSLAKRLQWVATLINLLKTEEEIKGILTRYGYTEEDIAAFEMFFKKAEEANSTQNTSGSDKKESYVKYSEAFADLEKDYLKIFDFAKLAFKKIPEKSAALQLTLPKPIKQTDMSKRIQAFLDIMLKDNEILEKMGKFNYTKESIQAIKDKLKKTEQLYLASQEESREYHSLVEAKKMAMAKMEELLDDLIDLIRVVFADRPDILKKLIKISQ